MAKNKNVENEVVGQQKNKKAKPFLVAGLVLLGVALAIGAGWFLTSSIVLLRNALYLSIATGAGIVVATPIVKGISNAIANKKQNNKNRERTLKRERTRENEQTLESVPVESVSVQNKQYDWEQDPFNKAISEYKSQKNNQKR